MVGRIRDPKGIDYPFKSIEKDPDEINFDKLLGKGENVYVLAHQPGIGKTYNVMKYLKHKIQEDKNFRFFFFTDRHEAIRERLKDWDKDSFSHWTGFENICDDKFGMMLYKKYHFSPSDICKICPKCCGSYLEQFKNNRHVFAPFNYLTTSHFKENPPDIIFLDESIKQFVEYFRDFERAKQVLTSIGMPDVEMTSKSLSTEGFSNMVIDSFESQIIEALKNNNNKLLKELEEFNFYNLFQYAHWDNIYNYKLKRYGVPSYYYGAFNAVVNGIPIVFMDATFNQFFFSYLLESYNGEMRKFKDKGFSKLHAQIFKKLHQNEKTLIYRMRPKDTMPKSSFESGERWNHTSKWLSEHMNLIMRIYGSKNVGIITFSDYAEICTAFGLEVEYFGNLRGSNILEHKPVLVIIGTYLPKIASWDSRKVNDKDEYFEDLIRKYFLIEAKQEDLKTIQIGAPTEVEESFPYKLARIYAYTYTGKIGTLYKTPGDLVVKDPAESLNVTGWFDEMYQAFHRNRGLRYPRIIFSYGWFPEPKAIIIHNEKVVGELSQFENNLREEFGDNIKKIPDKDVEGFFNNLLEYNKDGLIEEIIAYKRQHPDATITDVANIFRNYKRGDRRGLDTKAITWLFECIDTIKEQAKYPE